MKIGLISDTHDNLPKIDAAIKLFNSERVNLVLHCGDYIAPFSLKRFKELKSPLKGVFGNCDGEKEGLLRVAKELRFSIRDEPWLIETGGKRILLSHRPGFSEENIDFIIYGHTHKVEIKKGFPTFINPGEASGWLTGISTVVILDIEKREPRVLEI